jgi:diamine N-acetyltransferase
MIAIEKADIGDVETLADIGKQTFLESHGHCASAADVAAYVAEKYSYTAFKEELSDINNIYYKIQYNQQLAGYSKIIFNSAHSAISVPHVTKLERLYLLKEFYNLKVGAMLFHHNIELSKKQNQQGMWLFVWKENSRAVNFYLKKGFAIIGDYYFKISETHSNPNYQLLLEY